MTNGLEIKLTPLRKDVLNILKNSSGPMGAYEILDKLKAIRSGAEPPTVYRVLNYLVEKHLIHRIESQNAYVSCSHFIDSPALHHAILFSCKKCGSSREFQNEEIFKVITRFSAENQLRIENSFFEMTGMCGECG